MLRLFGLGKGQAKHGIQKGRERDQGGVAFEHVEQAALRVDALARSVEAEQSIEQRTPHVVRGRSLDRIACRDEDPDAPGDRLLDDLGDQPALADPGIAGQQHHAADAAGRRSEPVAELLALRPGRFALFQIDKEGHV